MQLAVLAVLPVLFGLGACSVLDSIYRVDLCQNASKLLPSGTSMTAGSRGASTRCYSGALTPLKVRAEAANTMELATAGSKAPIVVLPTALSPSSGPLGKRLRGQVKATSGRGVRMKIQVKWRGCILQSLRISVASTKPLRIRGVVRPLSSSERTTKAGRFNTWRLRAMQTLEFKTGLCGLSGSGTRDLWDLYFEWEAEDPPETAGPIRLRDFFSSSHAFHQALNDDIDEAVERENWYSCRMEALGETFEGYYRNAQHVILEVLKAATKVRHWAREEDEDGPSDCNETPLDGDDFRLCEEQVRREHGAAAFVLGCTRTVKVAPNSPSTGMPTCAFVWSARDRCEWAIERESAPRRLRRGTWYRLCSVGSQAVRSSSAFGGAGGTTIDDQALCAW